MLLVVGMVGCTSPRENAAVSIEDVPYDLTGTVPPTVPATAPPPDGDAKLTLYFVSEVDSALLKVERNREQPAGYQDAISALIAGPTPEEQTLVPMRSRLSESFDLRAAAPTDGLLAITVADEALFRDNPNRLPAQVLVCTLTEFSEITAVQLRDSRGPIPLSGANSESIEAEFARRENYDDCTATDVAELQLAPTDAQSNEDP